MNPNKLLTQCRVFVLGAINGLIFGVVTEWVSIIYADYELQRDIEEATRLGKTIPTTTNILHNPYIVPCIFVILFAAASFLVHRYWMNRPKSLMLLWQSVGIVAVTAFTILEFADKPFMDHQRFFATLKMWLVNLALAVVINLIYGMIIQLSLSEYRQDKIQSYK